jgi:hypothetical protein
MQALKVNFQNLQNLELFPEITSFLIFLGMMFINYGVVDNDILLKNIIGDILSVFKNKYPNSDLTFYSYDNPFLKSIIDNKDTVEILNAQVLPNLTNTEKELIKLNEELDIIINKIQTKNNRLKLSFDEAKLIHTELLSFNKNNRSKFDPCVFPKHLKKDIITKTLKKLTDYMNVTKKKRN